MSKAKSTVLLGLVESEDEDILSILEPVANTRAVKMPPGKRGRPAAVAKPGPGRPALTEKMTNAQEKAAPGRGKKRAAPEDLDTPDASQLENGDGNTKPKATRGRPRAFKAAKLSDASEDSIAEEPSQLTAQPAKRGRKPKVQAQTPPTDNEVPETQAEPEPDLDLEIPDTQALEAMDDSIQDDRIEHMPSYSRSALSSVQRPSNYAIPMSASRVQHPFVPFSASRRPMAASDSELNDPSLRRRLGGLTRKYESLEAKYRDLREIGVKEAERNYDRLKKQGEERANTADQLIATLKAQLAAQTELAQEGQRLREQLEASESNAEKLQSQVNKITNSLSEAKTEIKTLNTKLAASRAAEAAAATVKVPGSAMKGNTGNNRLLANAEAAVQAAQLKEILFGDLTGLIINGVKQDKDDEVYDCIQTGRNGTLHFKLSIIPEEKSEDFDDIQFTYLPQLDANRDRALLEILPDYLTEEITFPKLHAAKFYSRVMKFLTERIE